MLCSYCFTDILWIFSVFLYQNFWSAPGHPNDHIQPMGCLRLLSKFFTSDFFIFQSLVKFLAEAHRGIHGFVMDENGNPVEKASLKVKSRDVGFQTTKYGEFWRILLPGIYKLEVNSLSICNSQNIIKGL